MNQSPRNKNNRLFDLNSVETFVKSVLPNYLTTVLLAAFVLQAYSTIFSKDYWIFIWATISNLGSVLLSLFVYSKDYFLANLALLLFIISLRQLFKPKTWIEKTKYSQKEQSSFYVSQLIKQGSKITNKDELSIFCQDTVDILHNIFVNKSTVNNATWLIPSGSKLELLCSNKRSKYNNEKQHFSFVVGEGVVGNSWETGKIEYYSEKQENKYYKNRVKCSDTAYICSPILEKSKNKYGVIAVGSEDDIYWEGEDIESIRLICTVVLKILNDLDDDLKTQFDLQALQGQIL